MKYLRSHPLIIIYLFLSFFFIFFIEKTPLLEIEIDQNKSCEVLKDSSPLTKIDFKGKSYYSIPQDDDSILNINCKQKITREEIDLNIAYPHEYNYQNLSASSLSLEVKKESPPPIFYRYLPYFNKFVLSLFALIFLILPLIILRDDYKKHQNYKKYYKYYLLVFSLNISLFFLLTPGFYDMDFLTLVHSSQTLKQDLWLGLLWPSVHNGLFYLSAKPIFHTFIYIYFVSFLICYLVTILPNEKTIFKLIKILLILSPGSFVLTQFIVRDIAHSYLYILFAMAPFLYKKDLTLNLKTIHYFLMIIVCILLREDTVIILLPLFIFFYFKKIPLLKLSLICGVLFFSNSLFMLIHPHGYKAYKKIKIIKLNTSINMIFGEMYRINPKLDLLGEKVFLERFYDFEKVKQVSSPDDIDILTKGAYLVDKVRTLSDMERRKLDLLRIKIIISNLGDYFTARNLTFQKFIKSDFSPNYSFSNNFQYEFNDSIVDVVWSKLDGHDDNNLFPTIRPKVLNFIYSLMDTSFAKINFVMIYIFMLITFILKKKELMIFSLCILMKELLLYFLAPASYFKYHYTLYLSLFVLSIYLIQYYYEFMDLRKLAQQSSNKSITS